MNKQKQYLLFISILLCFVLKAQQDSHSVFYKEQMNTFNPAFTATESVPVFKGSIRSQWLGVEGAPKIQVFSFGIPGRKNRLGFGGVITNDKTFIEQQTKFYAAFSYRLQISKSTNLYLGIQAGGNNRNINHEGIYTKQSFEVDSNLQNASSFQPNFGLGAYIQTARSYVSFGIPQILETHYTNDQKDIRGGINSRLHLYASAGTKQPIKGAWFDSLRSYSLCTSCTVVCYYECWCRL